MASLLCTIFILSLYCAFYQTQPVMLRSPGFRSSPTAGYLSSHLRRSSDVSISSISSFGLFIQQNLFFQRFSQIWFCLFFMLCYHPECLFGEPPTSVCNPCDRFLCFTLRNCICKQIFCLIFFSSSSIL